MGDREPGAIRANVARVIEYLDGVPEAWRDLPPNTPLLIDPKVGRIGLLTVDQNQNPPGYLDHMAIHLTGLVDAPGATSQEIRLANQIHTMLSAATGFLQNMRTNAQHLLQMTNAQLQQASALALLNDLVTQANDAYVGVANPATGQAQGGVTAISDLLAQLGQIPVFTMAS